MTAAHFAWWLLAAAVTLAVIAWVLRPLVEPTATAEPPDPRAVALLAARESAVATVRDLDADYRDGRIDEASYHELRAAAVSRAAGVLAAIDRLAQQHQGQAAAMAAVLEEDVAAARDQVRS